MTRVIQLTNGTARRVALVDEPYVRPLQGVDSVYALALIAAAETTPLSSLVGARVTGERLEYDAVHAGASAWRLLPPFDHPVEPARCLVSGTGLTHLGSARDRDAMHDLNQETGNGKPETGHGQQETGNRKPETGHGQQETGNRKQETGHGQQETGLPRRTALEASEGAKEAVVTDSMRMFQAGVAGGRPRVGCIGAAPEWFYKGTGDILRAHGEPLVVPAYGEGAGEEAEIAGIYIVDPAGQPRRVGMAVGNEFSDHGFEERNYLYLAGSKLSMCALGPELVIDAAFDSVPGEVWIERGETTIWAKRIASGEAEMCHSLQNIEHHHFKVAAHVRPGDVHVHFFGAHSLSFGDRVTLADGDVMGIRFDGFGRALRNAIQIEQGPDRLVVAPSLG